MLSIEDLHDYQKRSVSFIKEKKRCALFVGMGLGKTATALTAVSDLLDGCAVSKVLIIAPLRVANSVWKNEVKKWEHLEHLKVSVVIGSERKRRAALQTPADVYTINRENISWLVMLFKKKWPFDCVIVDESSSFKNQGSKRFRALKKVLPYTEYMVLLTGTPSPNGLLDLWSQAYLIDFGVSLGRTYTGYKKLYFKEDYHGHSLLPASEDKIHNRMKPYTLSMSAEDYLELEPAIKIKHEIELPKKVMQDYLELEGELLLELEDGEEIDAVNAAVLANKLLQFSNGASYVNEAKKYSIVHNEKLDALEELIECNDEPVLVSYNFKHDLERIKKRIPDAVVLGKDPDIIDRWNRKEIKVLLTHPQSAGHGLNLQDGGSLCIWFGLCWSLEYYQQLNKRLDRQGQKETVRIIHLVAKGCIDERVLNVLSNKDKTQKRLLDALKP